MYWGNFQWCCYLTYYKLWYFRMQIYNGLWPTTWDNLLAALVIVFLIMYIDHPKLNIISYYLWAFGNMIYLDESYPHFFRMFMISLISSVIYFIVILYARQYFLRMLLSYKGWLCKLIFCKQVKTCLKSAGNVYKSGTFQNSPIKTLEWHH